jgi:hypothetical protein
MTHIFARVAETMIFYVVAATLLLTPASAAPLNQGRAVSVKARSSQSVRNTAWPKRVLLGDWTLKKGEGQFEDMVFQAKPKHASGFRSYLRMRPDFWGSWSLKSCSVTIAGKTSGDKPVTFTILSINRREMRVLFGGYNKPGSYKRI